MSWELDAQLLPRSVPGGGWGGDLWWGCRVCEGVVRPLLVKGQEWEHVVHVYIYIYPMKNPDGGLVMLVMFETVMINAIVLVHKKATVVMVMAET